MSRWVWFSVCALLGLAMLICGLLVPAHLRAVDASVLQKAGRNTPALVEKGLLLVRANRLGAAQLLSETAQHEVVPGREELALAVSGLSRQHPAWQAWGGGETHLEILFDSRKAPTTSAPEPVTDFALRFENRGKLLDFLRAAPGAGLHELLQCRELTNTVIFPPSQSSSGQAFDASVSICGLLLEERRFNVAFSNVVFALAFEANRGANPQALEQVLLDVMSLGQRFNWGQLAVLVERIEDAETLRLLGNLVRRAGAQLPLLYSTIVVSEQPASATKYLMNYSQTGLKDAGASLRFGSGGLAELFGRNQRLYSWNFRRLVANYDPFGAVFYAMLDYCWHKPGFALTLKWAFYLIGGFLIAAAMHFARPAVSPLEQPLQVRGFHIAREILFALGFLLVVLLLSEPFLAEEGQKVEFPFRLQLPTVGKVIPVGKAPLNPSFMNKLSLLTLLLFFVLQALIYTACLFKLAEIRRQRVLARIKIRLLENEEHLFDAGLYLGFAGTIISLILVSLGVIKPSLMAAYSSTSFGIVFVSIFKIFNLRPVKRRLLLEAEGSSTEPLAAAGRPAVAAPL